MQASNGLNRRFFKGVGNSGERNKAHASADDSNRTTTKVKVVRRVHGPAQIDYLIVSRYHCRAGGCQSPH